MEELRCSLQSTSWSFCLSLLWARRSLRYWFSSFILAGSGGWFINLAFSLLLVRGVLEFAGFGEGAESEYAYRGYDKPCGKRPELLNSSAVFACPDDDGDRKQQCESCGEHAADAQSVAVSPEGDPAQSAEDQQAYDEVAQALVRIVLCAANHYVQFAGVLAA